MEKIELKENQSIKGIKSLFFIRYLFFYLDEKQKLRMISYNKELQKISGVNIDDYKRISGKYKIGEKNGKGKEYILHTTKMIFEGEYINGKRNGKGKEYDCNGQLRFEREYLNGKKWNGKGYNENEVDSEIKEGKGLVKKYGDKGKVCLIGEYLNGEISGKVIEYNESPYLYYLSFKGEYVNGKEMGKEKNITMERF